MGILCEGHGRQFAEILRIDDGFGFDETHVHLSCFRILWRLACLQYAQNLRKVLFDRCQVHLVQTNEEGNVGEHLCFHQELDELRELIPRLAQPAVIPQQLCRVMPIWFHLNHAIVPRRGARLVLQTLWARLESELPHDSTLACAGNAGKKKEGFGTDGGEVGGTFCRI